MRTTMSPSPVFLGVLAGVLALVGPVIGADPQCTAGPNIAGIVIGSILATLAVVGIIIAIIFFIRWKKRPKKAKAATKTGDAGLEQAHVNPAFQDDSTITGQHPEKANDVNFAEQGFAGYVPCKEFEHAVKKEPTRSNGSLGRSTSPLVAKLPMHNFGTKLTKSGSHGSLDDSYPSLAMHSSAIELSKIRSLDPEVINVPLQSQDIIGLGFNICGNLRDGIFVSQVLNRGPASESRLIKPGDRILGITISFENMVYEDALTILSYASPYPVKLQVQKKSLKASDPDVTGDDYEEALHLHHPKYRSQSMDDVSKIAQESVSRMRRAWSEMKRGSSKRKQEEEEVIVEENRLRRWSGKPNHGEPVGDAGSDEKSDNSAVSIPDLHIDATDLMASYSSGSNKRESTEVTVHQEAEEVELIVVNLEKEEINLEEITLNQTEAPTLGLSPKRQAEADRKEGLRLSYEVDRPIRKLDLEEAPDLELKKGGLGVDTYDMGEVNFELPDHGFSIVRPDSPDLGLAVKRPESPDLEFSLARRDSQKSQSSNRNSPSPVILTGSMGLDLKIGAALEDTPDVPVVLVPDVGQEVAIASEPAYSPVIVTEHDGFLDIDLKSSKISTGHTDSSSPPPSPPPGPPPLLSDDSAADVTESSMIVLVNEESILRRDDDSGNDETEPVVGHAAGDHEDDSVHAMLKDYFSDQPSLMERLGLSTPAKLEGNTEEVVLPKRLLSDSKVSGHHEPLLDEHIENSRVLQKAKEAIRRRSSSSEEEPHVSSPSTLSSRSSSPAEPYLVDEQHIIEHGDKTTPPKERKGKSHSPLVKKRSTGGLMYDISSSEYHEMAVDVPEKDSNNPPGGVAYFVSIDEHFHGAPLTLRPEEDEGLEDEQVDQPSLVKAWGLPNMSGHYNLGHVEAETSKQVNEVVTIDTRDDGPTSIITDTRTTTVTLSNNNNESGMNGKGGDSPIGSPLKSTKELVTTTEVSKSNEVITVTRHEEIQGAYTVTVNASSHNDDSEA